MSAGTRRTPPPRHSVCQLFCWRTDGTARSTNIALLTVGDFGFDGVASVEAQSQDPATSYGKTIAINIGDGRGTLFTWVCPKSPQGLYIERSGTIWSTEHGPQGGDELNRLVRGANYGWPYATYGTDYGSFTWPLNKPESETQDYQAPVFAWVPSIAISNLLAVEGELFPQWRGDLLIASLKAQTLFRARVREGHIAYLEPIVIGSRIRDLIEGHDGRIILWTDDDACLSAPQRHIREALFAEKCSAVNQISGNRIGDIYATWSVGGLPHWRAIGLLASLRGLRETWDEKRLDSFLKGAPRGCSGNCNGLRWRCKRRGTRGHYSISQHAPLLGL